MDGTSWLSGIAKSAPQEKSSLLLWTVDMHTKIHRASNMSRAPINRIDRKQNGADADFNKFNLSNLLIFDIIADAYTFSSHFLYCI